ncbi:MAG: MotA/TolQ/ExbB proton channel family protein [Candidatus Binatia bacterium]
MIDFFNKGGIFMYPILLCSITALAIFIERLWNLRQAQVIPRDLVSNVEDLIRREKIHEAAMLCQNNRSSLAQIFLVGIKNFGRTREAIKEHLEEVGRQEVASLGLFVEGLGTIAGISTLLGLLGTISGMIKIFSEISNQAVVNPGSLAGGISEALITTYAGLSVAIPTIVMYKYLQSKSNALILEMERRSIRLVDLLKEKKGND